MSNTAASVLSVARSQLGVKSGKKYWDYVRSTGVTKNMGAYVNGSATPYCACGVSWVFHEAGARCAGLPATSCTYQIYPGALKAKAVVPVSQAKPGDVILFNFDKSPDDAEHVGIVEEVHEGYFKTVEFNTNAQGSSTGGGVWEKVRPKSNTFAIIRPQYDKAGKDEWVKQDGRWWYRHADGSYTTNGWERIDGKWYYFDAKGWMVTGWVKWKGKWCWLKPSGACAESECLAIKGKWYAFGSDGYMKEGYVWLDNNGAMKF